MSDPSHGEQRADALTGEPLPPEPGERPPPPPPLPPPLYPPPPRPPRRGLTTGMKVSIALIGVVVLVGAVAIVVLIGKVGEVAARLPDQSASPSAGTASSRSRATPTTQATQATPEPIRPGWTAVYSGWSPYAYDVPQGWEPEPVTTEGRYGLESTRSIAISGIARLGEGYCPAKATAAKALTAFSTVVAGGSSSTVVATWAAEDWTHAAFADNSATVETGAPERIQLDGGSLDAVRIRVKAVRTDPGECDAAEVQLDVIALPSRQVANDELAFVHTTIRNVGTPDAVTQETLDEIAESIRER